MTTTVETTGVAVFITSLSAALLTLLGLDYYSLVWALIGSGFGLMVGENTQMTKRRAIALSVLTTLIGAAIGTALAEKSGARSWLIVASLVSAFGAQPLVKMGLHIILSRGQKLAGGDDNAANG